jgi:large subunit ribosomal protein L3
MPRVRSPKRGSRAFSPRKRAKNINGRINFWPDEPGEPHLQGFAGYKAGMSHVFYIQDRERSPDFKKEMKSAVTILDTPPLKIVGLRAYEKSFEGLKALTDAWIEELPVDFPSRLYLSSKLDLESGLEKIEDDLDKISNIRILAATQPRLTSVSKKKPDLMEINISGNKSDNSFFYAKELLGKEIRVSDVFDPGESIDIIGVTKGKGFQGPVKRWGIRILQRKSRKTVRGVASIGPWKPRRVMSGVPRAGQMGLHHRTEFNKRIFMIGSGSRINPNGGFKNYGEIKGDYLVVRGSIMGPAKRLIKMRKAVRKPRFPSESPEITFIKTEFNKI